MVVSIKNKGFDIVGASSENLVDMGGSADKVAKTNKDFSDEIKAELRKRIGSNLPNKETSTITGQDFVGTVGVVSQKATQSASNDHLIALIGQSTFNQIAKVPISLLKGVLDDKDYKELISVADGTRSVSFKELD